MIPIVQPKVGESLRGKCNLSAIVDMFKLVFSPELLENPEVITQCYKVHIKEVGFHKKKEQSGRVLSFWCLSSVRQLKVTLNGKPIVGSPFAVEVRPSGAN